MTEADGTASEGNPSDEEFSLANLVPLDLSWEEEIAYEVAVDLLNEVIGIHSGKMRDARESANPDAEAALSEEQSRFIAIRNGLHPADHEGVARARQECSVIIKKYYATIEQSRTVRLSTDPAANARRMHHERNACHFCGRFVLEVEGWAESVQPYRSMRAPWDVEQSLFDGWFHLSCVRSFDRRDEFRSEMLSWVRAGPTMPVRSVDRPIDQLERLGLGYTDRVHSGVGGEIYKHPGSDNWMYAEYAGPVHFLDLKDVQALCRNGVVRGNDGVRYAVLNRDPGPEVTGWGLRQLLDFLDVRDLYQGLLDWRSPEYAFLGGGPNRFGWVLEYALSCERPIPDEVTDYFRRRLG